MRFFRRVSFKQHPLKHLWVTSLRRVRDEYDETQEEIIRGSSVFRMVTFGIAGYLLLAIALGVYWSMSPSVLSIRALLPQVLREQNLSNIANVPISELPAGVATTSSLIAVVETLWKKPGGYIANDVSPPSLWLDNMPYWESGVIVESRAMAHMLLVSLSQSSANSNVDEDLKKAEVRLNFSAKSWLFPSTESAFSEGVEHYNNYVSRLTDTDTDNEDAHFYVDAQHLNDYLAGVEQRLKNLSQRLSASVGPVINTDIAAMPVTQTGVNGLYIKTPWMQLDNVFFEARGSSWALMAFLQGLEMDFSGVLLEKNAQANYEQIIRELEATQQTIYSPMILNGEGFGFIANHSLAMSTYISRTQAAVADCRRLLLKASLPAPSL